MKIAIVNLSNFDDLQDTIQNIHYMFDEIIDPQIDLFIEREYYSHFEELDTQYNIQTIMMKNINPFDLKLKYDNIRYYAKAKYDISIDTQTTFKSAIVTYLLSGRTAGMKIKGFKGKLISLLYDETINVLNLSNKDAMIKEVLSRPFGFSIDA